jgi:RimJ/RimL family protein N-acetyltransferase
VECWAFGGEPGDAVQVEAWGRFIRDEIFHTPEGDELDLHVTPAWEAWAATLSAPLDRPTIYWPRRHYECRTLAIPDWASRLPEGMSMQRIDADLLDRVDRGDLKAPSHTIGWTENNWASRGNYLRCGFGFCTVNDPTSEVVSWSVADCISGDRCEIGIHTHPDFQRRGLATLTTAAAVDHALTHGFRMVGWHCNEHNLGSIRTAEKVGFTLERTYQALVYLSDPGNHAKLLAHSQTFDPPIAT